MSISRSSLASLPWLLIFCLDTNLRFVFPDLSLTFPFMPLRRVKPSETVTVVFLCPQGENAVTTTLSLLYCHFSWFCNPLFCTDRTNFFHVYQLLSTVLNGSFGCAISFSHPFISNCENLKRESLYCVQNMRPFDLPREITDDNLKEFLAKAKEIRDKFLRTRSILVYLGLYLVPTTVLGFGILYTMLWLAFSGYFNFLEFWFGTWTSGVFSLLAVLVLALLWVPLSVFYMLAVTFLMQKHPDFPSYEEMIFAECLTIAANLKDGERVEAQKEARLLRAIFTSYVRNRVQSQKKSLFSRVGCPSKR